jgi:hypothetical protein
MSDTSQPSAASPSIPGRGGAPFRVFRTVAEAGHSLGRIFGPLAVLYGLGQLPLVGLRLMVPFESAEAMGGSVEFWIVFGLFLPVTILISVAATAEILRDLHGMPSDIATSLRYGVSRALPILALSILWIFGFVLGFVLLIVPGLIFLAVYAFAFTVAIAERLGPIESFRRSAQLSKGRRWRVFGMFALIGVVAGVIQTLPEFVLEFDSFVFTLLSAAIGALVGAFSAAMLTVAYKALVAEHSAAGGMPPPA